MNKPSGGGGIPVELFQILKDDAVKVLHSICQHPFVPRKRLPDWASLELSPSVESCGCGLGPSPVRLG